MELNDLDQAKFLALKAEKERWSEVVTRSKLKLATSEKELNARISEICKEKEKFCNEANEFEDQYGVLSSWWNAETIALHDPLIGQNAAQRQHKRKINAQVANELDKIRKELLLLEEEKAMLKKKIVDDGQVLLEIEKAEEEMKLQPFGPEFQSLRADVQTSKEAVKQWECLVSHKPSQLSPEGGGGPSKLYEDALSNDLIQRPNSPRGREEGCFVSDQEKTNENDPGPCSGIPMHRLPGGCKVFKLLETTTFTYQMQSNPRKEVKFSQRSNFYPETVRSRPMEENIIEQLSDDDFVIDHF